ncbi:Uncharacterized protein OBRU01_16092 [Operophtera brumata]|uniref:FLYWCH-type domain-containing protein n=1 Tax=Operophtera brumata TaxID=104452 RepID=A0A0L7L3B4_OPEBR|nr:Uncharacterized protein OBRU01_16092 [Operophtera brumata]
MVSVARYLATSRGARLLYYQGNTYFINSRKKQHRSRLLWYCSSRKSRSCPASILTLNDRVLGQPPAHTHPPKLSLTYCHEYSDDTYVGIEAFLEQTIDE